MKRLKLVLSLAYWLVVAALLWIGYVGDAEIDRASTTPVTHSPAFDTAACFGLAVIAYGVVCAVWWATVRLTRRTA
jgi:hypothetical protein